MGFGDWLKGKTKGVKERPRAIRRPGDLITAFDERGREVRIKRADWVSGILAPGLEKAWDEPDALYQQLAQAVRDEFIEQLDDAADHLVQIDRESDRALTVAGVVKLGLGDLDGAEKTFRRSIEKNGPSGHVLMNLARVFDRRGENDRSLATLREAIDVDPNNQDSVLWWAGIAREKGGQVAYVAALEELARRPGAWQPALWLARARLSGDRAAAFALYDSVLSVAGDSGDVLMMVTGDLGNAGALEDLIRLAAPRYNPETHGPLPGLNLVQAYKTLGRAAEGRALVRRLQSLQIAPFAARLAALDAELGAADLPRT